MTCPAGGVSSLAVDVADRDDVATNATQTPSEIRGGDGADTLLGGDGDVADRVSGEGGNDVIDANAGPDIVSDCGRGRDRVLADATDRLRRCERVVRSGP